LESGGPVKLGFTSNLTGVILQPQLVRSRGLTFLLKARVRLTYLAAHGRLIGRSAFLCHAGEGISGVSLIFDWIPTSWQRKLAGGDFLSRRFA
jgi:hypothetical protein